MGKSDNIANSVQLLLQLPIGTELGKKKKVNENNGQLCFLPPQWVEHASRLDQ